MTYSQLLIKAAEAARLFPATDRLIGPAGLNWFARVLIRAGAGPAQRLECYLAVRLVIFGSRRGNLTGWFGSATVGQVISTLETASCEVV